MIKKIAKLIFLCFLSTQSLYAQFSEYEIKAAYLKSISLFVDWPKDSITDSAFVITVIGDNPFNNNLESLAKGTTIHQKPIKIKYINEIENEKSQIIFISKSEKDRVENIIKKLDNKNCLIMEILPVLLKEASS